MPKLEITLADSTQLNLGRSSNVIRLTRTEAERLWTKLGELLGKGGGA